MPYLYKRSALFNPGLNKVLFKDHSGLFQALVLFIPDFTFNSDYKLQYVSLKPDQDCDSGILSSDRKHLKEKKRQVDDGAGKIKSQTC